MTCYFLPYHNCGSLREIENKYFDEIKLVKNGDLPEEGEIYSVNGRWANAFLTRYVLLCIVNVLGSVFAIIFAILTEHIFM